MPRKKIEKINETKQNESTENLTLDRNSFFSITTEHDAMSGAISEDILFIQSNSKNEKELEQETYQKLRRFEKDGEILWGVVSGVESFKNHAVACIMWNNFKISIPDTEYIEPYYDMGKNYASMDENEKFKKRLGLIRYQIGAIVPFTINHVERNIISEGPYIGEYETTTIGSRIAAMKILRDIFYFHKNRKIDELPPRTVNVGDKIQAHVLAVRPDSVLVECCGKETRLGSHNLLPTEVIEDCTNHVRPGMTITVKVKTVIVNEALDTVDIAVTGRTYNPSKAIRNIKVGGMYLGVVETTDDKKQVYTIILNISGIKAMVPYLHVKGHIPLLRGDVVQVCVNNVFEQFVAGSAQKQN